MMEVVQKSWMGTDTLCVLVKSWEASLSSNIFDFPFFLWRVDMTCDQMIADIQSSRDFKLEGRYMPPHAK